LLDVAFHPFDHVLDHFLEPVTGAYEQLRGRAHSGSTKWYLDGAGLLHGAHWFVHSWIIAKKASAVACEPRAQSVGSCMVCRSAYSEPFESLVVCWLRVFQTFSQSRNWMVWVIGSALLSRSRGSVFADCRTVTYSNAVSIAGGTMFIIDLGFDSERLDERGYRSTSLCSTGLHSIGLHFPLLMLLIAVPVVGALVIGLRPGV